MNNLFAHVNETALIDMLLQEQSSLTAVDRFTREHEQHSGVSQQRYYQTLLPTVAPGAGEQFAFNVDLDACTGCKACVSACHSLNGLEDEEIWRNVGILHSDDADLPYQQTITTACHHCIDPACLSGCPVQAYEKDPRTGVVRHLDDQCIGCQYCILKCPYDVPKYSKKRGIVRKCDMCVSRLSVGEAPACVQACPNEAITIRVINQASVKLATGSETYLVPGAFPSSYTIPTTKYLTARGLSAAAQSGDVAVLREEPAHWPLIGMLVLTQIAAGLVMVSSALAFLAPKAFAHLSVPLGISAFASLQVGLGVSVLHLGQPLKAWRAFLGWRTSWMSREILVFGGFAIATGALVACGIWDPLRPYSELATHCAAIAGLVGVACSVMVYVDTRRAFWSAEQTGTKFCGTAFLLGIAATTMLALEKELAVGYLLNLVVLIFGLAFHGWQFSGFTRSLRDGACETHGSASLMWTLQRKLLYARLSLWIAGTTASLWVYISTGSRTELAAVAFILLTADAFAERYQFFTAVIAPRMPGPLDSANAQRGSIRNL